MASDQYICQECGTVYASRQERDEHETREHGTSHEVQRAQGKATTDSVNCPTCGAQFSTPDQMHRHARQEHRGL
jgi:uncharacterized C2H2 Zn-finger protein